MAAEANLRVIANTLADVAHALASAQESKGEAVQHTLQVLRRIVPYERCGVRLAPPGGELFISGDASADARPDFGRKLEGLLRRITDETDAQVPDGGATEEGRGHLAVPLLGLNQIAGVLYVEQEGGYDEDALRLLSVVAAQLGAYLTTLRLREEEVERARQLGIALQRLEEMDRRKDDFLAMLGHELRNPLGAINNALHVIDSRSARDEWRARYHHVIDRQISHLSRIVDDLLDASRVRLGKIVLERRPVDLRSVAERWREAFGTTGPVRSHQLSFELAEKPVMVLGDPVRLEQILANLLANALKYTPTAGRIQVTVSEENGEGLLRVRDTGIGIGPDMLPRIFDLFAQADESLARSQGGLGLGLSLVRGLVEMHGGRVEAHSALGEGSEFVVRLPISEEAAEVGPAKPRSPPPPAGMRSLRILVVEDNQDARETLQAMLELWDHQVEACGDGIEGLRRALTHPPEVALIDIGLPGIDGFELARRFREQLTSRCPYLLAMTGYGQPESRRRALDMGFDAYMVKPFDPDELEERLRSIAVPPG